MDFDKEIRDKIIETSVTVKFIREKLEEGTKTFKDHGERLRTLEQNQQYMAGKIVVIVMGVGMVVLFLSNILSKIWK